MTTILSATDLAVAYPGGVRALDGADIHVAAGETVALVGESGSGKTTLGMAAGRLLPRGAERIFGALTVGAVDVFSASDDDIRALRRDKLGFIFQNPMDALDPTMRIGGQLAEAMGRQSLEAERAALLARARLDEPERILRAYPHELSGGMAQRVVIAMAIARSPRLLIADEPTASLDASIREKVMDTLKALSSEAGAALLLMSHDLRIAARHADRLAVMYGGRVVEAGPTPLVFSRPAHPYTAALLGAAAGREGPGERLRPIAGAPPTLRGGSQGCAFAPRCALAAPECRSSRPGPQNVAGRTVVCFRAEETLAATGAQT